MLKGFSRAIGVFVMLFFCFLSVNAEVFTTKDIGDDGVFVVGNHDFYPIEYYNKETKSYEGIIPEILEIISERTGIDFIYVDNKNSGYSDFIKKNNIAVVSSYMYGSGEGYAADEAELLRYEYFGKTISVGLAFTDKLDKEKIAVIKAEISNISPGQMNGYIINDILSKRKSSETSSIAITFIIMYAVCVSLVIIGWVKVKKLKKQMLTERTIDEETGIGNLTYFENRFSSVVMSGKKAEYTLAYIIADNNFFREYQKDNTYFSPMRYAAETISAALEENDFAARITESGFIVAYSRETQEESKQFIEGLLSRLNKQLDSKRKLFYASAYDVVDNDFSSQFIIFNLRRMCTEIIGADKSIVFCNIHDMNSEIEEKKLSEEISEGLKNNEFRLFLQFVVDNETKAITSCEALSRWEKNGQIIPPGEYIGTMEKSGLVKELDYYMFEMVCRQLHKWQNTELGNISISCNITRMTLSEEVFLEKIRDIMARYVFDKKRMILEITEEAIETDVKRALNNVIECKSMGFTIALDDMGSGYTSLSNLCDYLIDIVKIDRNILLRTNNQNGKDLFEGMAALAHSLGKKVVCEGVETEEQNSFVSGTSCDYIQGFYYSAVFPECEGKERFYKYNSLHEEK